MAIYENMPPDGHLTFTERIFTKIKSLFDTKVQTDVPANAVFTDEKVTQTESTADENFEVLVSGTASTATTTEGVNKSAGFKYNPYLKSVIGGDHTKAFGGYSHAEGYHTTASGQFGHAEGNNTKAIGYSSHTEGGNTIAQGNSSHAEGYGSSALGDMSHAEGYNTSANAYYSHTEGNNTRTAGYCSHAEGNYTTAIGQYSHAEGDNTITTSDNAHAEGYKTTASGQNSHAEGGYTYTDDSYSHAEGYNTSALGYASHTEGYHTKASGEYSHAEGTYTFAIADGSHAEGYRTTASGEYSHAEGTNTSANGYGSHAEGDYSISKGYYSHAEGGFTTATHKSQHVFGEYNLIDASTATNNHRGNYVEIVGNGLSSTQLSNARTLDWDGNEVLSGKLTVGTAPTNNMDVTTKQYVDTAIAESGSTDEKVAQTNTTTNADYRILLSGSADNTTHTEGANKNSKFTANPSTGAVTFGTRVPGSTVGANSFAQGTNITASGSCSHAEGNSTTASGFYTHAEGENTIASGYAAHAEGKGTEASGSRTHVEGHNTTASGSYSHAEGEGTYASGNDAHTEGGQTTASGLYTHAEGGYTIANHKSQHVFGEYNIADASAANASRRGTYIEIVGNGTSNARSNARTLDWDGNQYIAGLQTDKNGIQTTKSLTQAEYDALTPAQKSDGTVYYITDAISTEESELWSRVGRGTLHTDAQVISNAVNELKDVIGSGDLDTTAQDLSGAVNELNSKFEKISEQGQIAISNITSAERLSYRRVGDVVILDLTFTVGTAIPSSSTTVTLFKGFPHSFSGRWRFRLFHMTENKIPIQCCVTPDGTIENAYSTGGISTGTWTGQATYICQDD